MIEVIEKKMCCGCGACVNVCPKKAIKMIEDKFGFKYPTVDKKKCINCGLCEKVCPIKNKIEETKNIQEYACYNKNEFERLKSSSGGIFILLAKSIISKKGVVFGATLNNDNVVEHNYSESIGGIKQFMGSKYVQSNINLSYCQVKKFLDEGRYVLFTGTPCQIAGLKKYLKKDYKNLYTQDIICHGVPSPLVWEKYKEYRLKKDKNRPIEISFRNKDNGWNMFNLKFNYKGKEYKKNQSDDLYMKAFLRDTILRDSCYDCKFKDNKRMADITLADYWGVENVHTNLNDDKGISLMLINSEKGKELLKLIKKDIFLFETNIEKALPYNPAIKKSAKIDKKRNEFFENLDKMDFKKNVKKNSTNFPIKIRIKKIIKKIIPKSLIRKLKKLKHTNQS